MTMHKDVLEAMRENYIKRIKDGEEITADDMFDYFVLDKEINLQNYVDLVHKYERLVTEYAELAEKHLKLMMEKTRSIG